MSTIEIEPATDHVTVIRPNRPERLNAISFELVADLHDALDTAGQRAVDDVRRNSST